MYRRWYRSGDIVLVNEDALVPTKWPLARVIAIHPGKDGCVRVVSIKTPTGEYKRPTAKIVSILPIDEPVQSDDTITISN